MTVHGQERLVGCMALDTICTVAAVQSDSILRLSPTIFTLLCHVRGPWTVTRVQGDGVYLGQSSRLAGAVWWRLLSTLPVYFQCPVKRQK